MDPMRITLEADYAVRIVQCLADYGARLGAGSIAERTGVSLRFALKILRRLASAGVVRSFKGAGGGYILAKRAEDITLREVIETIEGPIVISRCQCEDYVCDHPDDYACYYQKIFEEAAQMIREKFDKVNFGQKPRPTAYEKVPE